jgi:hypothetical protein
MHSWSAVSISEGAAESALDSSASMFNSLIDFFFMASADLVLISLMVLLVFVSLIV